jgi:hypothetical protein
MKTSRKIAVTIILGMMLVFVSKSSQSQMFWLGFNGGYQYSWFKTPGFDYKVTGSGPGWNLGFFLKYGKRPFYMAEFRWMRANNFISYEVEPGSFIEGDVPFHKFEMPVKVGYNIIQKPIIKWHVNGGASIGTVFLFSENNFEFERRDMRNPQVAVIAGTGIQFMNFIIDFDYAYHLNQLFKGDERDLGVDFGAHLQVISVKVGWVF